jgi:hypothetical protein
MKLDGTETPKPTPFDAHEQVVRGPHTFVPVKDASVEAHEAAGYKADPDFESSEYPKAIAHNEANTEPVIANSEEEE